MSQLPPAPAPMGDVKPDEVRVVVGDPVQAGLLPPLSEVRAVDPAPRPATHLVDELVGQINGRPIYAHAFFEPMRERLAREAQTMREREWLVSARKQIQQSVADRLRDDLLLAEFQSTLTPEQRLGVLAFVETVREGLISGNLGSESLANQRLREAEGLTLDEKVKDVTERRFILEQLRNSIGNRVQVSFRDVRRAYEQNIEKYRPPPVAVFRIILVPRSDAARVGRIESALAAGEDFTAIAKRESAWKPSEQNLHSVVLKTGSLAEEPIFGPKPLNEAARGLTPGGRTSRVDVDASVYWVLLERIEQPPGKSLYEAQLEIERELLVQREEEERIRYFDGLLSRGSYSDVQKMIEKLLIFAAKEHLGRERAPGAGGSPAPR